MTDTPTSGERPDKSGIVVGVVLLVLAGVLWMDAVALDRAVAYGVGPSAVPKLIAVGLVVLGILSIISGWRAAAPILEEVRWGSVGLIIGGFLLLTVLIGIGAGFIPAMVVLFVATSAAFGSRAYILDVVVGLVIAVVTYLVFSKLLTLSLPQGPLERLFG